MPAYSADALVLRTYRYGEADRIVVFLTADRGKKRGVAKNATVSRRRFGAALEPLTRGRATYMEREQRELVRLDRVEPRVSPFAAAAGRPAGDGAHALAHAAYFAELIDEWAQEGDPNEALFRLGSSMVEAFAAGAPPEPLASPVSSSLGRCAKTLSTIPNLSASSASRKVSRSSAFSMSVRLWPVYLT